MTPDQLFECLDEECKLEAVHTDQDLTCGTILSKVIMTLDDFYKIKN